MWCRTAAAGEPQLEEAFVSFATPNYFPLLEVLVDSVERFSSRPIVAFGVGADIPLRSRPCLIKRRIEALGWWRRQFGRCDVYDIYRLRPKVVLAAGVKFGVYLDADSVVSDSIDELFGWTRSVDGHPLCARHPHDPDNQADLMRRLGVARKTMPYVHGHFVFAPSCRPFLQEWSRLCSRYRRVPAADETILNVLLWKEGASRHLPLYDPYFEIVEAQFAWQDALRSLGDDVRCHVVHGCKDPARAAQILLRLRGSREANLFSTREFPPS